jgi:tripartite-type tricarboxylate transporter receptor subunit TctC
MIQRRNLLSGLLATSLAGHAAAQAPTRTGRLLVGFPPGGSVDLVARSLAEHVKGPTTAVTMIVDNRPGAGGRLALETLKAAAPDGATVGLTPGDQLTLFPSIYNRLGYDPLRDFAPIATVCTFPFALAIGPLVPMDVVTLADFMAWCQANPKQANFGSPGEGTRPHFMGMALARAAGVELTHLPYKGGPAALQDLLAGQVAAMVTVLSNVLPHAQSGRLRVLVVSAPQRSALLPATPTASETGYAQFEVEEWFGVLAPAATSAAMVEAWSTSIRNALAEESVIATLSKQGFRPASSSPQELSAVIRADLERWRRLIKEVNFKPVD